MKRRVLSKQADSAQLQLERPTIRKQTLTAPAAAEKNSPGRPTEIKLLCTVHRRIFPSHIAS